MKKILVFIVLLSSVSFAQAHEANISTTMVVKQGEKWLLQVRTSLTAFQTEVRTHFADTPYKTPDEFKAFAIAHAKNNISVSFDGADNVVLKNPYIKLGHETVLIFELVDVPADFKTIQITNSCFKDVYRNQSSFVVMKEGFSQEEVF